MRRPISTRRLIPASIAAVCLVATACSSSQGSSPAGGNRVHVKFQLNYEFGGPNAGFAVAIAEGYYKDVGLNVELIKGNGSSVTAQLVAQNQAPLGFADAIAASNIISKGAPLKVVSTIYQTNPLAVASLKSANITSVADLEGKTVGGPSGGTGTQFFPVVLAANDMSVSDVKVRNIASASLVPSLLRHQVDAILSGVDSYSVHAMMQGAELNQMTYASLGAPTVSTSIIANINYLKDNRSTVKKFIRASLRGWSFAVQNVDKAVAAMKEVYPEMNKSKRLVKLELQGAIDANLFCANGAQYLGKAGLAQWRESTQLAVRAGLLPEDASSPRAYYTNRYLPPDAKLTKCTALQ